LYWFGDKIRRKVHKIWSSINIFGDNLRI
jgi:hypothetical protein